ncbi:MAG: class I SAM-dependent methyltransferase [Chitinivibrionales bacterium]|nr:class I SAM-dependent methyltransferase [Chitinivibrionales bacterium]
MGNLPNPTQRFSNRVENYVKYRPRYPQELMPLLQKTINLNPSWRVADIGSGTGFSAEPFLKNGNTVYAIEPNEEMRQAGQRLLLPYADRFISVNATAEQTSLADASIDCIVTAQAFHWFEPQSTRREFTRILRPQGWVVIVWNERKKQGSALLDEYEALLRKHAPEYEKSIHRDISDNRIEQFFGTKEFTKNALSYVQHFNGEALIGRMLSSSYVPVEGADYDQLIAGMTQLHDRHQVNGTVAFEYDTLVYCGKIVL